MAFIPCSTSSLPPFPPLAFAQFGGTVSTGALLHHALGSRPSSYSSERKTSGRSSSINKFCTPDGRGNPSEASHFVRAGKLRQLPEHVPKARFGAPVRLAQKFVKHAAVAVLLCAAILVDGPTLAAEQVPSTPEAAPSDVVYHEKPDLKEQVLLRDTFDLLEKGKIDEVESRLTKSIAVWKEAGAPPQQLATLYKYRADVKANLLRFADAVEDYTAAIREEEKADADAGVNDGDGMLCLKVQRGESDQNPAYCVYTPSLQDLYLRRGRCAILSGKRADGITDISKALALTEEEGARNPWALLYRADAQRGGGQFAAAAEDYGNAAKQFKEVGDAVTAEVARAGRALALYGAGRVDDAVQGMEDVVLRVPTVNGEVELLLSLAEKEADVHAALAAHYWGEGRAGRAETEWDRACTRLDAMDVYVSEGDGGASPYDKRDSQGKVMVKAAKPFACRKYRDPQWVLDNRQWPPALASKLASFFSKSVQPDAN